MQFKTLFAVAPLLATALAAPATNPPAELNSPELSSRSLESRQVINEEITTLITELVHDVITLAATEGAKKAGQLVMRLKDWTKAREEFTKETVQNMWATNPDPKKYPAVVCYNMGYKVQDPAGVAGKFSAGLKTGPLHVNYDCMYMAAPNTFTPQGDGGFINYATVQDKSRCSFDNSKAKVLSCK